MKLELSIARARAKVMLYEEVSQKWIPASYTPSFMSNVDILHHFQQQTFRIVAVTQASNEMVLNSSVKPGLRYNEATGTFHQWRDQGSKQVFGLHFVSEEEAAMFGSVMSQSLQVLNSCGQLRLPWPGPDPRQHSTSPELYSDQAEAEAEDLYEELPSGREEQLYQHSLREAARPIMELSQDFQRFGSFRASQRSLHPPQSHSQRSLFLPQNHSHQPALLPGQNYTNPQPSLQDPFSLARSQPAEGNPIPDNDYIREDQSSISSQEIPFKQQTETEARYFSADPTSSSAPAPAPAPPPTPLVAPPNPPPPPPPPPPPASSASQTAGLKVKSLSGDLQSITLNQAETAPALRKVVGMASMMEEMKNKLARRKQNSDVDISSSSSPGKTKPTTPTTPTTSRSQNPSQNIPETFSPRVSTSALSKLESYSGSTARSNLEALKTEILEEIRSEMEKSKMEIIEIIREEIKSLKSNQ